MKIDKRYKRPYIFLCFAEGEFDAEEICARVDCDTATVRNNAELWRSMTVKEQKYEIKKAREYVAAAGNQNLISQPEPKTEQIKEKPRPLFRTPYNTLPRDRIYISRY